MGARQTTDDEEEAQRTLATNYGQGNIYLDWLNTW